MPAVDQIHDAVKNALIKEGWTITHDPYIIRYEGLTLFADLAAERLLALERGDQRIVVEIKSFLGASPIQDFKVMLGQYHLYRGLLDATAPERRLYLAISDQTHQDLFGQKAIQLIVQRYQLPLLVVNVEAEEVVRWIT
jgi:hypothetical protein